MRKSTKIIILTLLLILCLVSCKTNEQKLENYLEKTYISSLKDTLETTNIVASQWQSDYYFVGAHIGFGYSSEDEITVLYESPTKPDIALAFSYFYGTTMQQQITTSSDPAKEIKNTDSVLDSPEILEIALSQKDSMKFSRDHFWNICGYLNLDKRNNFPGHPPIWRVEIQDCRDPINSIDIYLDPKTGERLIE